MTRQRRAVTTVNSVRAGISVRWLMSTMLSAIRAGHSRGTTSLRRVRRHVPGGHLGAGTEPEAQPDALEVRLRRSLADAEAVGQLTVRQPFGHECGDL